MIKNLAITHGMMTVIQAAMIAIVTNIHLANGKNAITSGLENVIANSLSLIVNSKRKKTALLRSFYTC